MTDPTPGVQEAVTGYARAVREALTDAGINLAPGFIVGAGDPPTIDLRTTHRRGYSTDPQRYTAVIEWDGAKGWAAGWFDNLAGGGTVHDRGWLDLGLIPNPGIVAASVVEWFSAPERFSGTPGPIDPWTTPASLLTVYGPGEAAESVPAARRAEADAPAPDLNEELRQLRAGALSKSVTYWQGIALDLQKQNAQASDDLAALSAEAHDAGEEAQAAERTVTDLRASLNREALRGDTWADRADEAAKDRDRYRAQALAVRDLCGVLRGEGLAGPARRIEDAMHDADITVAQQRAAAPRTPDGRVVPPPGPIELTTDREWLIERGAKITADECARCGNQIVRGQLDDGPWTHTETDNPACRKSGGAKTAMPKTYADLVGHRVVVLGDDGVRTHGFLRATNGDLLCLDDVDETVDNIGIDLRIGEITNVSATARRRDQETTDTAPPNGPTS